MNYLSKRFENRKQVPSLKEFIDIPKFKPKTCAHRVTNKELFDKARRKDQTFRLNYNASYEIFIIQFLQMVEET